MRELYADELRFLDAQIGRLADFLTRMGILDNTVLVVTSDHGENFGDHGMIEHQLCLYNTLLHVPLIIRFPPSVEAGTAIDAPVSTTFLFQTIAELIDSEPAGIRPDFERRSLLRSAPGQNIYSEYENAVEMLRGTIANQAGTFDFTPFDRAIQSIQQGRYKLILSSNGREELYEVAIDPAERKNLIHREPGIARELKEQLHQWQHGLVVAPGDRTKPELDPKTREALRALGYLE
jgi:arylsulfatase A-like enzyme